MYALSINSFVANWLLLFFISPFSTGVVKSPSTLYKVSDPVHYEFQPIQLEKSPTEEKNLPNYEYKKTHDDYTLSQHGKNQNFFQEKRKIQNSELSRNDKETRERNEEITKKMNILNKILSENSNENDVESQNSIENRIIAEANLSEETKRVVRQVRKQRPGFFWTLGRLAFETFNDTRSAIKQVSQLIGENFEPDTTTSGRSNLLMTTSTTPPTTSTTPSNENNTSSNLAGFNFTVTTERITTTTMPYKFTVNGVQNLILRNVRGLVRLFNIEWQDALNQSEANTREFQKSLGNEVGKFLQDDPNAF